MVLSMPERDPENTMGSARPSVCSNDPTPPRPRPTALNDGAVVEPSSLEHVLVGIVHTIEFLRLTLPSLAL